MAPPAIMVEIRQAKADTAAGNLIPDDAVMRQ